MKLNIKKLHPNAVVPSYANIGDAGLDLTAVTINGFNTDYLEYGTGLAIEIPEGHVGLIFPRSSISKYDLSLSNAVGVIDSGYRGEIKFRFKVVKNSESYTSNTWGFKSYQVGDRIGQLVVMPIPKVECVVVDDFDSVTTRGIGGFGSSGN